MKRIKIAVRLTPNVYAKSIERCLREKIELETAIQIFLFRWTQADSMTEALTAFDEIMSQRKAPEPKPAGLPTASPGKVDDSETPAGGLSDEVENQ